MNTQDYNPHDYYESEIEIIHKEMLWRIKCDWWVELKGLYLTGIGEYHGYEIPGTANPNE